MWAHSPHTRSSRDPRLQEQELFPPQSWNPKHFTIFKVSSHTLLYFASLSSSILPRKSLIAVTVHSQWRQDFVRFHLCYTPHLQQCSYTPLLWWLLWDRVCRSWTPKFKLSSSLESPWRAGTTRICNFCLFWWQCWGWNSDFVHARQLLLLSYTPSPTYVFFFITIY
jgi:hypothetical protein